MNSVVGTRWSTWAQLWRDETDDWEVLETGVNTMINATELDKTVPFDLLACGYWRMDNNPDILSAAPHNCGGNGGIMKMHKVWGSQQKLSCWLWWIISHLWRLFLRLGNTKAVFASDEQKTSLRISGKPACRCGERKEGPWHQNSLWKQSFLRTQFPFSFIAAAQSS